MVCFGFPCHSGDCHVRKWHPESGVCASTLQSGHSSVITCMLADDSETLLLTGSVKGTCTEHGAAGIVFNPTHVLGCGRGLRLLVQHRTHRALERGQQCSYPNVRALSLPRLPLPSLVGTHLTWLLVVHTGMVATPASSRASCASLVMHGAFSVAPRTEPCACGAWMTARVWPRCGATQAACHPSSSPARRC